MTRLLLSAVLMMCCAVSALAQLGTPPNNEIWYTTTDGKICDKFENRYFGVEVTEHKYDPNGHGTIKFKGDITRFGEYAFYLCANLASVIIPGSVTSIGFGAFCDCDNLALVIIPGSVTSIEYMAFGNCPKLHEIFYLGNSDVTLDPQYDTFGKTTTTIYVADASSLSPKWDNSPVCSWRSGKGDGKEKSPYEIENYVNLYGFSLEVQQGNTSICGKLTADITANTDVLNEDGTLSNGTFKPWLPIGTSEKPYAGTFDGNGHTISGLYINDASMDCAALFGKVVNPAYIHDLGVKDSYFRGNIWVAGICGDFASGTIENCWNGATVIGCHSSPCTGGIAGSCWKNASVNGCYNIGNVSVESSDKSQCGGICGIVAKNTSATYSVSNCISLKGKCEEAYNVYTENYNYSELLPNESYSSIGNASVSNVYNDKDASAFKSGEVCWILNGNQRSAKWRQHIGTDDFPAWTGNYIVYNDATGYHNEAVCEVAENHIHNWMTPKTITQDDESTITYCRCEECRKYYQSNDRTIELSAELCTREQPSVGNGSKDNPYQIATIENLMWFADYVNGDSQHASACAILTADITMNTNVLNSSGNLNSDTFDAWTPIGGHNVDYSGEFNGNGHTISGLYFKDKSKNNVGLFGKLVGNAHIHDLGIKDSYFYGHDHVGGICGDFASGRIENCWSGAYVMAHEYDAGGISGSCYVNASIANCYNIGDVSTYEIKDGGLPDSRFGGICGSVYSSSATYSIDNCYTLKSRAIPEGGDPYEGLPYVDYRSDKIYGFLVDNCPASKIHDSYVKNAEAFVGGEVCYRLNHGVTDGSQKWFQTLGSDLSPVMDNGNKTVYYGYDGNVLKYSNSQLTIPTTKHEQCDATCNARGYSQDCWEDTKSGRIYAEEACLNELNAAAIVSYKPLTADPTDLINQGDVTGWTKKENQTYDGVSFGYAAEKVFKDNSDNTDNYGTDEWVSFKVADTNAQNARLKWAWTGDRSKQPNGRYGDCDLYYKVNNGGEMKITTSTLFEVSPDVYVLNLGNLSQNSEIEFHIKGYANKCTTPNEVTWAVTLEYVSGHNPQHISAKAATCTENGNKENWYCNKCDKHFTSAECTTVMTDWEIHALGHKATHNAQKDATCTEDGNKEYWHCSTCGNNYNDEACTNQITGSVVIPATHHAHKEHKPYKAPTTDAEGNIEYWHCLDCNKNFGDKGCTKEVTDADIELAKLLNVLHIDFYGTSTPIEKEHYMDATEIGFNENGDIIFTTNKQADNKPTVTYPASMINEIGFFNGAPTVELKANKDPNGSEYYTTFYSSLEAYTLPTGVKAYTATVEKTTGVIILNEIKNGVVPAETAVVLISSSGTNKFGTCDYMIGDVDNDLQGTDVEIPVPDANCYVLSGTSALGMGLYPWAGEGKKLSANKAYLQLTEASPSPAKAFTFVFDEETTSIHNSQFIIHNSENDAMYNLNGVRVNDNYKGIVIKNGKKTLNK